MGKISYATEFPVIIFRDSGAGLMSDNPVFVEIEHGTQRLILYSEDCCVELALDSDY